MATENCCTTCSPRCKLAMRRLGILLWKNLLLRRRKCCCTVTEVIVAPILIFIVFICFIWLLPSIMSGLISAASSSSGKAQNTISFNFHSTDAWEMSKEYAHPYYKADEQKIMEKVKSLMAVKKLNENDEIIAELIEDANGRLEYEKPPPGSFPLPPGVLIGPGSPSHHYSISYPGYGPSTMEVKTIAVLGYAPFTKFTEEIMHQAILNLGLNPATTGLQSFSSGSEIEDLHKSNYTLKEDGEFKHKLVGAIVFDKGFRVQGKWAAKDTKFPKDHTFSYTIRLVHTQDGRIPKKPNNLGEKEDSLPIEFETDRYFLYKNEVNKLNKIEDFVRRYVDSGFAGLQIAVDKAIIKLLTNKLVDEKINIEASPYKAELFSSASGYPHVALNMILPLLIIIPYSLVVLFVAYRVNEEKSSGIKELMKMSGLTNWMHWAGWMIDSLGVHFITTFVVMVFLIIPYGDPGAPIVVGQNHMSLWWFVLLLFVTASTAFGFFMSSLFWNGAVAGLAGFFAYMLTGFAVVLMAGRPAQYPSFAYKMATSLVPCSALHWAFVALSSMHALGDLSRVKEVTDPFLTPAKVGAKWNTMGTVVDNMSVGYAILMLFVDTVIYTFLAIYLENVAPGEYGVRKPFYYFLIPPDWMMKCCKSNRVAATVTETPTETKYGFETEPDLPVSVEVIGLTKQYRGRPNAAVNSISFKMFDGEITVLLGHNGAGKTTAMSMITGMLETTSGTALVNGRDINREMDLIHQNMGLCPQKNIVFPRLTVLEHMKFFALIKGLSFKEAQKAGTDYLEKLRLLEKINANPKTLSGGETRKLCLGMSMIGDTKFLVLDEPSTGMDPENRRLVWDLLQASRSGRSILLTTHFMDEADALGDRIMIMADGEIKCSGSPMYLKQIYGAGYTLKFSLAPEAKNEATINTVLKYIPNASLKDPKMIEGSELSMVLPTVTTDKNNVHSIFPSMFNELTSKRAALGALTMNLQVTTMDEVFLRVGELYQREDRKSTKSPKILFQERELRKVTGIKLCWIQFYAILLKRILFTIRNPFLIIIQLTFPAVMIYFTLVIFNIFVGANVKVIPAIEMKLSDYSRPITYFSQVDKGFGNAYQQVVGPSAIKVKNARKAILTASEEDRWDYKRRYVIGAAQDTALSLTALFSPYAIHSCPLSINAVTNAILRKKSKNQFTIEIASQPIKGLKNEVKPDPNIFLGPYIALFTQLFIKMGLALFGAIFIVFPLSERLCGAKHLQMMTGVSSLIYWAPQIIWDYLVVLVAGVTMLVTFEIYRIAGGPVSFNADGGYVVYYIVFCVYGFSAVTYAYMYHRGPRSIYGGIVSLCILPFFFEYVLQSGITTIPSYCSLIFGWHWTYVFQTFAHVLLIMAFPVYGGAACTRTFLTLAKQHDLCRQALRGVKNSCDPKSGLTPLPQCCRNCKDFNLPSDRPCLRDDYFNLVIPRPHPFAFTKDGAVMVNDAGLGLELIFLFLGGCLYIVIYFIVERKALRADLEPPPKLPKAKPGNVGGTNMVQGQEGLQAVPYGGPPPGPGQPFPPYDYSGQPMTPNQYGAGQPPLTPSQYAGQHMPPGQYTGQPMPPGQYTGQPMPPGQYAGQPMPSGQYTGQPMPPGQYTGQPMPPGQYAAQQMPPGQYAAQQMPPGQYAGQPMPPGQYTGQPIPPGQYAGQPMPPGQYGGQQIQPLPPNQGTYSEEPKTESKGKKEAYVIPPPPPIEEDDVLAEIKRVQDLISSGKMDQDALVVDNLWKQFAQFAAVSELSFGVHYGECFGLLGVNGAGKTTAFRMIAGDERATKGNAYTHSFSLLNNTRSYLKNIGYCPQQDAFFKMFTGKQMLELYCRLRGIDASASDEADRWLTLFGLSDSANLQCDYYSGGMKRRLNAAIAMIGDPSLILFDEPTSGVDPMAQHQFWDMILSMRGSEQAVVLTSHSMKECEALCSRLGIMVNGQFQCFGGAEHLKQKYGEGYTLFIKLKSSLDQELVMGLQEEIEKVFNPCKLQDQHLNIVQYQVLDTEMSYGQIFQATENLKSKFNDIIEEYSVNDTTLEEVFLGFARKQHALLLPGKQKCSCRRCLFCDCNCCQC